MRTAYKCMECGNDRMISTALCGTNCARCGSHNISLIDRDAVDSRNGTNDKKTVVIIGAILSAAGAAWWMIGGATAAAIMGAYGVGLLFGALCIGTKYNKAKRKPHSRGKDIASGKKLV